MKRVIFIVSLMASVITVSTTAAAKPETKQTNPVVSTTTTIATPSLKDILPPPEIPPGVTEEDMKKWQRVAICEEGGNWQFQGPIFSGGLGFRNYVWLANGGGQYAPNAGLATPEQQVAIAKKINGDYVPDQNGCGGGW